jgi:hypothetical protein
MSDWTLGAVKSMNLSLEGKCQGCPHFYVFDVDALIARNGADALLPDFIPNMVCSECGGRLKTEIAMLHAPAEDDASGKE